MLVNFVNTRAYDTEPLHQFSKCHKAKIRYKKVCDVCNKEVLNPNILKGTDAEHILTQAQQDKLKEALDNQTIEILSFEQENENFFSDKVLLIQKSQMILPSMSKGFKMNDVNIFISFCEALKELNIYCKVKYVSRAKEHYGVIAIYQDNLIFLELPFFSRLNTDEITRLKEQVSFLNGEASLKDFAVDYIKSNIADVDYELVSEKKAILVKQYLEKAIKGEIEEEEQEIENPFICEKKRR